MAAIVSNIAPIARHKRMAATIFKPKTKRNNEYINYNATNVMQNNVLHSRNRILFLFIDKMTPFINKHPNIGDKIITATSKLIKKQQLVSDTVELSK